MNTDMNPINGETQFISSPGITVMLDRLLDTRTPLVCDGIAIQGTFNIILRNPAAPPNSVVTGGSIQTQPGTSNESVKENLPSVQETGVTNNQPSASTAPQKRYYKRRTSTPKPEQEVK